MTGAGPARGPFPLVDFLGLDFAQAGLDEVLAYCRSIDRHSPFGYITTPNVDHLVELHPRVPDTATGDLWVAQQSAALRLCDSRILARLADLGGQGLAIVPGSDLTAALFARVFRAGHRIAIVGGSPGQLVRLRSAYPELELVQFIPPMGVRFDRAAQDAIVAFVEAAAADYTLFTFGAPQSEIVASRVLKSGRAGGLGLCVGASLAFLVGEARRAPRLVQQLHLEWAFRLAREPRRMWRRYLVRGPRIFAIWWAWHRSRA